MPVTVNINCHASRHASAKVYEDEIKYSFDNFQYDFAQITETNGNKSCNPELVSGSQNHEMLKAARLHHNVINPSHEDRVQHEVIQHDKVIKGLNADDIEEIRSLKVGDIVYLNGYIYTARDAAHKKLVECINRGEDFPIDIKGKIIYYVGHAHQRKMK